MPTLANPNYSLAPGIGLAGQVLLIDSKDIEVGTADITLNSLIKAFKVRKGQKVVGAILQSTDLDTNGSPAIVMALGDLASAGRFITGATIGQAGGVTTVLASTGTFYTFTDDTDIYIKITTAAATAAAGTIRAALLVVNDQV